MSYVSIYTIDKDGALELVDEVANARAFHLAVWGGYRAIHGMRSEDELWSRVATLPRPDGLIVAATFDRCWIPIHLVAELMMAMCQERRFVSNMGQIGSVISERGGVDVRGYAFEASVASPWSCPGRDGEHRIDAAGHACQSCGKRIMDADHVLAGLECCR